MTTTAQSPFCTGHDSVCGPLPVASDAQKCCAPGAVGVAVPDAWP